MEKNVVMIIRKSGLDDILKELLNEITENKILIRIMKDDDFDVFMKTGLIK